MRLIFVIIVILLLSSCSTTKYFGKLEIAQQTFAESKCYTDTLCIDIKKGWFDNSNLVGLFKNCDLVFPDSAYENTLENLLGTNIKITKGSHNILAFVFRNPPARLYGPVDGFKQYYFYTSIDSINYNSIIPIKTGSKNFSIAHIFGAPGYNSRCLYSDGTVFIDCFNNNNAYGHINLEYNGLNPGYLSNNVVYKDSLKINLRGIFSVPVIESSKLDDFLSKYYK